MKLSSALLSLLLSTSLIVGCNSSHKTVALRDQTAAPTPTESGNNSDQKPTKPAPGTPGDSNGQPVPVPVPAPTPAPTPEPTPVASLTKVARIVCEAEAKNTRSFNTLRSDVVSTYNMPSLVPYLRGRNVLYVKSPVPLQSDGNEVVFLLRAQEDALSSWKVYKAVGNLRNSTADLKPLSNYPGAPAKGGYAYENLKLDRRILGANIKRTAYVYPADDGTYTWESLKGSQFTLPFNANTSFNPTFLGGDDYVRFDQERDGSLTLTQKFYNFTTKKTLSLPPPLDGKDHQLFSFIDAAKTNLYWVEGRPEAGWKWRFMNLARGKAVTLGTLPGNAASFRLPLAMMDSRGEVVVAYSEEEVALDKDARPYFKTSAVHLVRANTDTMRITADKTVPYSQELVGTAISAQSMNEGILGGFFFEPISGKLFVPVLSAGGLASFDPATNAWETHGMISKAYGCLNPEWGIEVTNE